MKINLEVDERLTDTEITIRTPDVNDQINRLMKEITEQFKEQPKIAFYQEGIRYFIDLENILFFETVDRKVCAHTNEDTDTALYFVDKVTSSTRYLHNKQLEQVTFEVSLGDLKAYFDDVVPAQSDLVVNLNVSMGQAELFIPQDWQVSNELEYTMGTVNVPDSIISDVEGITVHLRGQVSFGQVNVHYI